MTERRSPLDKCTDRARNNLRRAYALSIIRGNSDIQPADMVDALSNDNSMGTNVLGRANLPDDLPPAYDEAVEASAMAAQLMDQTAREASKLNHTYAGSEHQLLAMTQLHPEAFSNASEIRRTVLKILGCA